MLTPTVLISGLISFMAVGATPGPTQAQQGREVLAFLIKQQASRGLNALICGVWRDREPIAKFAIGHSMTGVPATLDMHFRAGGVTYTCVTTLLLMFVDQGKVSLKDPVARWFPKLPDAKDVTVGMLANCTSGYPDYVRSSEFINGLLKNPFQQYSPDDLERYAFATSSLYAPGRGWNYSHTNFVILGDILEKVGKRPLGALLDKYLFKPLKLRDTYVPTTAEIRPPVLHAFYLDRSVYEDCTYWNPSWAAQTGMMISTIPDLGVLAQAIGTGRLLSRRSFQIQIAPTSVGLGSSQADAYYGFGIIVLNGWLVQNPNIGGYSTIFAYLPSKKLSIVITSTKGPKSDPDVADSKPTFVELVKLLAPDHPMPGVFR